MSGGGTANCSDLKMFGQELRKPPVQMIVDAVLMVCAEIDQILVRPFTA